MTIYDKFGKETPYKIGVITKRQKGYALEIGKNKNDIFQEVKNSKDKKELKTFAQKNNIKVYNSYKDVYYS